MLSARTGTTVRITAAMVRTAERMSLRMLRLLEMGRTSPALGGHIAAAGGIVKSPFGE